MKFLSDFLMSDVGSQKSDITSQKSDVGQE